MQFINAWIYGGGHHYSLATECVFVREGGGARVVCFMAEIVLDGCFMLR